MKERVEDRKVILRHSRIELTEHWVLALSGFLLIFSGFGELPMYKRFMLTQIPGLGWIGDFFINLKIHYLAGIVFVSVMVFHTFYHGWLGHRGLLPKKGDLKASLKTILSMFGFGKEPKSDKYLAEQRLAYAYLAVVGLILVLTGLVKVIKNLPGVFLPPGLITSMTLIHTFGTLFFLLGVMAHLAALIFKVNRPLVKSIFTGTVDLDYTKDRHTIWYESLREREAEDKVEVEPKDKDMVEAEAEVEAESQEKPEDLNKDRKEEGHMATTLKVGGMSCQHCVRTITEALGQLGGIENVRVDLEKGEVQFDNKGKVSPEAIEAAIKVAGYEVLPK